MDEYELRIAAIELTLGAYSQSSELPENPDEVLKTARKVYRWLQGEPLESLES